MAEIPQRQVVPAFTVVGLAARTNNPREMSPEGRIGPLWQAFYTAADARIPGVSANAPVFSVYTGYEADHNGDYDVVIGRAVPDSVQTPPGMSRIAILEAVYLVFPAAGSRPEAIVAAWRRVYDYFALPGIPPRAFTADFERHSRESVELYIAIR